MQAVKERAMTDDIEHLRQTIRIASESRKCGNHPFGAMLVGPEGDILIQSRNTYSQDRLGHAEANVARAASLSYTPEFLAGCTLYTSVEPCCMCAGAS